MSGERKNRNRAIEIILVLLVVCAMVFVILTLYRETGSGSNDRVAAITEGWGGNITDFSCFDRRGCSCDNLL